jgi:hypothetical protein
VAQGLREGPFAVDGRVERARWHRQSIVAGGLPCLLDGRPGRGETFWGLGIAQRAAGEPAIQLGVDQRHEVDTVDQQPAVTFQQPRGLDLHAGDLAAADDNVTEVATDEPRPAQAPVPGSGASSRRPVLPGRVASC